MLAPTWNKWILSVVLKIWTSGSDELLNGTFDIAIVIESFPSKESLLLIITELRNQSHFFVGGLITCDGKKSSLWQQKNAFAVGSQKLSIHETYQNATSARGRLSWLFPDPSPNYSITGSCYVVRQVLYTTTVVKKRWSTWNCRFSNRTINRRGIILLQDTTSDCISQKSRYINKTNWKLALNLNSKVMFEPIYTYRNVCIETLSTFAHQLTISSKTYREHISCF